MTRSSTKELLSPYENLEHKFRSRRRVFDTQSLVESNSSEFDHNFDIKGQSEEEVRETMTEIMEQYMSKTRGDYESGVTRPTINQDTHFELKGQFFKELRDNTFSVSEHKGANEHIEKSCKQMAKPSGSITTWEVLKTKFLNKYCPPARTAKKMEEINNFQQEPDESLFRAWERFKELLMKCPQHYLTDMQEDKDEGKSHAGTLIDIPVFVGRFSIISGFTIIDDDDMTKDVVLGMKFCKKYASCQMIMKKFALGDKCEQIMKDDEDESEKGTIRRILGFGIRHIDPCTVMCLIVFLYHYSEIEIALVF
ncbi:retrovirus-related pol polyprotein from transposon TNT 1-94 [Tanacetum coccineum]